MDQEQIGVSVICTVYNHEKYLRQCLDGFVMQKTTFPFEVLVHDDASTDHSADIIREYEEKYPDIIKPIYQTENQFSKGRKITFEFQYPRVCGRYVAFCEGDDFWTDPMKLQKQFDELEKSSSASICTHRVQTIDESGAIIENHIVSELDSSGLIQSNDFLKYLVVKDLYLFHTTSFFIRTEVIRKLEVEKPDFVMKAPVGDAPLLIYCALNGDCVFLDDKMSCYRMNSIGSWSCRVRQNQYADLCRRRVDMWRYIGDYIGDEFQEAILYNQQKYEFKSLQASSNYKEMVRWQYREQFSKLSNKEKMYAYLSALFPFMMKKYKNYKNSQA